MTRCVFVSCCMLALLSRPVYGEAIGFVESFALTPDRGEVLAQLVPGTDEHFFYSCLHAEQQRDFDEVTRLLNAWIKQLGRTSLAQQMEAREKLLQYDAHPEATIAYLSRELGLRFDHRPPRSRLNSQLPHQLDSSLLSRETLMRQALRRTQDTAGFTEHAFEWLFHEELTPSQRRHLLERLSRPDYPNLAEWVVADLKQKDSRGFGSSSIHKLLLREQLDRCLELMPALRNQQGFVDVYVTKLIPTDLDWKEYHDQKIAYLDRLWQFANTLDAAHNSLKAQILYRRLVMDRSQGRFDKARFMEYLRLPRQVDYVPSRLAQSAEWRRFAADLSYTSPYSLSLPSIGVDEPLVRSYLQHFFTTETDYQPYAALIDESYVKRLFAETKITSGLGDARMWYTLLQPDEVQAIKDRVELTFSPSNPTRFKVGEEVTLDLGVKNVKKLIVRVFHINAENYYRETGSEVKTDIELDGLVPNEELAYEYDEPSERLVRRTFSFPQLTDRGVYVIDFIGNGISSRAVVRKGALRYLLETGAGGQIFTVLDESRNEIPDASLWLDDREYIADADGRIVIPFTTQPGLAPLVIAHRGFADLHQVDRVAEKYELQCAFHVDRESLLRHRDAPILVRPQLLLSGTPIDVELLQNVSLQVTSTDLEGTQTTQRVDDFELSGDREALHQIHVPERLHRLHLELRGEIEQLSTGKTITLSVSKQLAINGIDQTASTEELHLVAAADDIVVEVLGRSGERRPEQIVNLELHHRDFTQPVCVALQTDKLGQVHLGRVPEVHSVTAKLPNAGHRSWTLPANRTVIRKRRYGLAGKPLRIPFAGDDVDGGVSCLQLSGGVPTADASTHVAVRGGYVELTGLTPGCYSLVFKQSGNRVWIRIIDGLDKLNHALGDYTFLELGTPQPLTIQSSEVVDGKLRVQLDGFGPRSRVHVFATRYQPAFSAFNAFRHIQPEELHSGALTPIVTRYAAGRDIGDEYRYVLERQYAQKFPGNLLERPSLLLNPWAVHDTHTHQQTAASGSAFSDSSAHASGMAADASARSRKASDLVDPSNLDFLADASKVATNLRPDKQGFVELDVAGISQQQLHLLAVDPVSTTYHQLSLPLVPLSAEDLRLSRALDPRKHYAQQKQVSVLNKGDRFVIPDITTARFDYYDSLPRAYQLFSTLSPSPPLADFEFITRWDALSPAEQRAKYSKYACHELHYFLSRRDPDFFEQTVRPYLANKKDKTFLDHWFLNNEVKSYLTPWEYARLNRFEQILLGRRVPGRQHAMQRHVHDLLDAMPANVDHLNHLFATALGGRALETGARAEGVVIREIQAQAKQLNQRQLLSSARAPQAATMFESKALGRGTRDGREMSDEEARNESGIVLSEQLGRDRYRRLYLPLEQTKEWVENNYYRLPLEQQHAQRVNINRFWGDFADHGDDSLFLSPHWAEASANFTEIVLALASLGLPFEAEEPEREFEQAQLKLIAASPLIVFHQQIQEVTADGQDQSVLVSQNFYRHDDRYETVGGVRREKCVAGEFLVNTVYGCQAVITNPTSTTVKADVLLQIPQGAIPVHNSRDTRTVTVELQPFASKSLNYSFYFPFSGEYEHFPVHVSDQERLLGFADPIPLKVVDELSEVDTRSWAYVSQFAKDTEVLSFLREHNVHDLPLERMAFRMQEVDFYRPVIDLLRSRHAYNRVLWSYSLKHRDVEGMNEFLAHADPLIQRLGPSINSRLLTVNPIPRGTFQHREYWPLVNARAHQLGGSRQILNDRFHQQYHDFMTVLAYQTRLDSADRMAVTQALLLQDRIGEALQVFDKIDRDEIEMTVQYDYLSAYLDCYKPQPSRAAGIVARYQDYPVDRWRERFEAIGRLLADRHGDSAPRRDPEDDLVAAEPSLEVALKGHEIELHHRHLEEVEVNYYLMDLELLFSRNPFVTEFAGQFAHIFPNQSQQVVLDPAENKKSVKLPQDLRRKNLLVEVRSSCGNRSLTYYANALLVEMIDNYGQLRVRLRETNEPLAGVYVKTYAMLANGEIEFYKDGYTDLAGRFDYSSLSTDQLDQVRRFAVLIMSDDHGAVVREAAPPSR